jgi:hypothetical protein
MTRSFDCMNLWAAYTVRNFLNVWAAISLSRSRPALLHGIRLLVNYQ